MSSHSLLMVLLVLTCLQSFTTTQTEPKAPVLCCVTFQKGKVPVHLINKYEETHDACHPGIIFTMKSGRRVCADPRVQWVMDHMDNVDLRLYTSTN